MTGAPMHIYLNRNAEGYKPLRILTARPVPVHFQSEAKKTVKILLDSGVIERVSGPTEWISPAFFVPKPNGSVRMVTDFSAINRFVARPVHPFSCPNDIIRGLKPSSRYFIKLDAVQGYHQIELDEISSALTTFLLPDGRYCYKRAPMGLNPSSDEWCARSDHALEGLDVLKIVDDILIQAETREAALSLLYEVLLRCRLHNITLSLAKIKMGTSVKFAGFIISDRGTLPDPEKTAAISAFPRPHDVSTVRSFLGLAQQLGFFVPDISHMSEPLRQLLKKFVVFDWRPEHEQAFQTIKSALTSDLIVATYDPSRKTDLLTDASRLNGLGYALVQYDDRDRIRLIQCGSRSLLPAETRYATIELECLAIQWAARHCRHYLLGGKPFSVITDHRPLLGIFSKPLSEIQNGRLLRFREKLADFCFTIKWVAGKTHLIADALSRSPAFSPAEDDDIIKPSTTFINAVSSISIDPALHAMIECAKSDENYQKLLHTFRTNLQMKNLPPDHPARAYRNVWDHISIYEDCLLIYDGTRVVVPLGYRIVVLNALHIAHAGIVKTKKLAAQSYFWPGMNSDLSRLIDTCESCQKVRPSQGHEPLQLYPQPDAPMTDVSLDLFHSHMGDFLIMVDRYSNFPFVARLRSTETRAITQQLEIWFIDWGYPRFCTTDGAGQFRHEFGIFCNEHFIKHTLSSAYNPRSNGLAEAGVKSIKHLISKLSSYNELSRAIMHWRNIPLTIGDASPAELFLGRQQRRLLPSLPILPASSSSFSHIPQRIRIPPLEKPLRSLHIFNVGDRVRLQDPITKLWDKIGIIHDIRDNNRSYHVKCHDSDRLYLRNRVFLKALIEKDSFLSQQRLQSQQRTAMTEVDTHIHPYTRIQTQQPTLVLPPVLRRGTRTREPVRLYPLL